jgi:hypothetical protein
MTRRVFIDTEWNAPPWAGCAELMWIGLADDDGRSWYGISSEVDIDPSANPFVAGAFRLIDQDEPRMSREALATAVLDFCDGVDEFWAWVPSFESFSQYVQLGDRTASAYRQWWDVDLQMLKGLLDPWPASWPTQLRDLNRAAVEAGVEIPPRAPNHLHPRVHAEWNRALFERLAASSRASI